MTDGAMVCASPAKPVDAEPGMADSCEVTRARPSAMKSPNSPSALQWTVDACASAGAQHFAECSPIDSARAAILCCATDGSTCTAVCNADEYPPAYETPLTRVTGSTATYAEAEAECARRNGRLCSRAEFDSGLCCSPMCGYDSARAWASDDCMLPSEMQPLDPALTVRTEAVRLSINGQQYSESYEIFGVQPFRSQSVAAFGYYDSDLLAISSIYPRSGPISGGTRLTITGEGFADLGARVVFAANGTTSSAPALLTVGAFRGRFLTCDTPAADEAGAVRIELSLNGDEAPPAATVLEPAQYFEYRNASAGRAMTTSRL